MFGHRWPGGWVRRLSGRVSVLTAPVLYGRGLAQKKIRRSRRSGRSRRSTGQGPRWTFIEFTDSAFETRVRWCEFIMLAKRRFRFVKWLISLINQLVTACQRGAGTVESEVWAISIVWVGGPLMISTKPRTVPRRLSYNEVLGVFLCGGHRGRVANLRWLVDISVGSHTCRRWL